ncbi:hypothetical protein KCP70_25000 [Salmonella enterica subsp. enterica]|nr:hypothetical protein KCP70_25000 [Salmonella enterica subsp. enterica]
MAYIQYRFKGVPPTTGVLASLVPLSSGVGLLFSFTTLIVTEQQLIRNHYRLRRSRRHPEDAEVNRNGGRQECTIRRPVYTRLNPVEAILVFFTACISGNGKTVRLPPGFQKDRRPHYPPDTILISSALFIYPAIRDTILVPNKTSAIWRG